MVSTSDAGIDVMAISVSSVPCTSTHCFSLPASKLMWKLCGKDECYLAIRPGNYRMCFSGGKKNIVFTCSLCNLF